MRTENPCPTSRDDEPLPPPPASRANRPPRYQPRSEVLPQVHPGVHARDLVGVAVEHEGLDTTELTDPALARLCPSRVIHFGIHVGIEAVLVGIRDLPRVARLVLDERDARDGLDALEAVLPRRDQPQRRAVLVWQRLSIEARHHERERVRRLIHPQTFHVRPWQNP